MLEDLQNLEWTLKNGELEEEDAFRVRFSIQMINTLYGMKYGCK